MDRDPRPDLPYGPADVAEATARLQAIAASLPEVSERLSHGAVTFFVRSKRTVCYLTDDHHGDGRLALVYPAPPGAQGLRTNWAAPTGWAAALAGSATGWGCWARATPASDSAPIQRAVREETRAAMSTALS